MSGTIPRRRHRFQEWIDAEGSVRAVAVLRILIGPVLLIHLEPILRTIADGVTYRDRFFLPYWDWLPQASGGMWSAMAWGAAVAAVALGAGFLTRLAATYAAAFVAYNLALSATHYHANRAFLLFLLVGLAVLPSGRELSVDAWIRRRAGRPSPGPTPLWPLWLLRFQVSVVYFASGFSKLLDPDWWGGTVTMLRVTLNRDRAVDNGVPEWWLDVIDGPDLHWWFAKVVVLTELTIAFGLWGRRTRLFAIWLAICFHLSIEVSAEVQVFSWAALSALCIWVTPRVWERRLFVDTGTTAGARTARAVRWFDWFARFEVVDRPDGPPVEVVDGDHTASGRAATVLVFSRLPATFPLAAPLLLLPDRSGSPRRADGAEERAATG